MPFTANHMPDRQARDQLIAALVAYMRGDIRTREFERRLEAVPTDDEPALREVVGDLWLIYDDFRDHPVSVPEETWNVLLRVLAALESGLGLEIRQVPTDAADAPFAPFWSEEQSRRYEPLLARHGLPAFDPAIHSGPKTPYMDISFLFMPLVWLFRPLVRLLRPLWTWRPRWVMMVDTPDAGGEG